MGSDTFLDLPTWRTPERLGVFATLGVGLPGRQRVRPGGSGGRGRCLARLGRTGWRRVPPDAAETLAPGECALVETRSDPGLGARRCAERLAAGESAEGQVPLGRGRVHRRSRALPRARLACPVLPRRRLGCRRAPRSTSGRRRSRCSTSPPLSGIADYFVLCTGSSTTHVQTIAEAIEAALKAEGYRAAPPRGRGRVGLAPPRLRRRRRARLPAGDADLLRPRPPVGRRAGAPHRGLSARRRWTRLGRRMLIRVAP